MLIQPLILMLINEASIDVGLSWLYMHDVHEKGWNQIIGSMKFDFEQCKSKLCIFPLMWYTPLFPIFKTNEFWFIYRMTCWREPKERRRRQREKQWKHKDWFRSRLQQQIHQLEQMKLLLWYLHHLRRQSHPRFLPRAPLLLTLIWIRTSNENCLEGYDIHTKLWFLYFHMLDNSAVA